MTQNCENYGEIVMVGIYRWANPVCTEQKYYQKHYYNTTNA